MKKNGNLYQVYHTDVNIEGNLVEAKLLSQHVAFYYSKLDKNTYLIVIDSIFRKNPIKRAYSIISEKKFKSLTKGMTFQNNI